VSLTKTLRLRRLFFRFIFLAMAAWGLLAITFSNFGAIPRFASGAVFLLAAAGSFILPGTERRKIIAFLSVFTLLLAGWLALPPRSDRAWSPDVAVLPYAEISGSSVTIRNIRNFDYRTETDYTARRYDRSFDLGALRTMDLFLVNWGLEHFSHAMLSFGFDGGKYVCVSIETRRKKGEVYSAVRGLFRQYELTYVVADERDLVRLRTNFRPGENVYLYRLQADRDIIQKVFLDYLRTVNQLAASPRWYNALTTNCTLNIWRHIVPYYPKAKLDWRIFASAHADEMVYELGVLDQALPLPELKKLSLINKASKAAGDGPDYSARIRRGLPGF